MSKGAFETDLQYRLIETDEKIHLGRVVDRYLHCYISITPDNVCNSNIHDRIVPTSINSQLKHLILGEKKKKKNINSSY